MALDFILTEKHEAKPAAEFMYMIIRDFESAAGPWPIAKFNASKLYADLPAVQLGYFDSLNEAQAACQADYDQTPP